LPYTWPRRHQEIRVFRIAIAILFGLIYATVRYSIFKGVPWSQWPVYICNKGLAMGASIGIVWILARRFRGVRCDDDLDGWTTACMAAHTVLSLAILNPAYYTKYFDGPTFTVAAGTSWLLGTLAAGWLFLRLRRCEAGLMGNAGALGVIGVLAGTHAALLGYASWFEPLTWHGRMPPPTLIAFALGLAALWLSLSRRLRRARGQPPA
jgi:hypothetical protein